MRSIFILVFLGFTILASAQEFKVAGVSYNYYPKVKGAGDGQELEDGKIAKYNSNTGLFMRAGLYYSIKQ